MFICPISGCRLIKARIKGGLFWYSPETDGRLMTLATVKHYLGEHASQEIWMRAANAKPSLYKCPGCRQEMKEVLEPEWVGQFHLDVCRACWLIWFDHNEHPEIPKGSAIDSHVEEIKKNAAKVEVGYTADLLKEKSAQPDSIIHMVPGIFLPTKTNWRGWPIFTLLFMAFFIFTYPYFNTSELADRIFFGLNVYFFYLFSSDLEIELTATEYGITLLMSILIPIITIQIYPTALFAFGLLPVNFCLMAMAIFLPLNAKFSYLIPAVHYMQLPNLAYIKRLGGARWVNLPQWLTILIYVTIFTPWFFYLRDKALYTQMKIVLFGEIVAGIILGLIFAKIEKINEK